MVIKILSPCRHNLSSLDNTIVPATNAYIAEYQLTNNSLLSTIALLVPHLRLYLMIPPVLRRNCRFKNWIEWHEHVSHACFPPSKTKHDFTKHDCNEVCLLAKTEPLHVATWHGFHSEPRCHRECINRTIESRKLQIGIMSHRS